MSRRLALASQFALLASAAPAAAGGESEARIEGDMEYGEYLSSECVACHNDRGAGAIPPIAGRAPAAFVEIMNDFRSGRRRHEVMEMIARNLDDEEIASLAVYFASIGGDTDDR